MFSFICALPSPASAGSCLPLFGRFTGSTAQSDFSSACVSVVRLCAFTDRPSSITEGALEISRFSVEYGHGAKRASNDAAVSVTPSKIPYGGFSPVRLQGRHFKWRLPFLAFAQACSRHTRSLGWFASILRMVVERHPSSRSESGG